MIRFLLGRCPHVCLRVLCLWFVPRLIYIYDFDFQYFYFYIGSYIGSGPHLLAQPALLARGNTVYSMPGRLSRLWGMRRDSPVSSLQPDIAHRVLLRVRPPACCASYSEMSSSHLFGVYPGRLFARPRPHPPPVSAQQTGDCTAAASGNAHQQHLTGASLTR